MTEEKVFLLHDEELEKKVLGSFVWLCREGNFDAFLDANVSVDLFCSPVNIAVFKAIEDLIFQGVIPDEITIFKRLQKGDISNAPEAYELVNRITWSPGQEMNISEHVSILRDLSMRRKVKQ